MIATYDAHNHDVLPETMFVDSLSALMGSGFIAADGDGFGLTASGLGVFLARSGGMFEIARSVLPSLATTPRVAADYVLPAGQYDQAVRDYLRAF